VLPPRPVIGILHPGAMGAAVGNALKPVAGAVIWAAAGRSLTTSKRAETADLIGVPDVAELARRADVIISVCPPDAARAVAQEVAPLLDRPGQLFVDANAVSPATVTGIAELLGAERVVDGAIIGPPAWEPGRTVVWLAGAQALPRNTGRRAIIEHRPQRRINGDAQDRAFHFDLLACSIAAVPRREPPTECARVPGSPRDTRTRIRADSHRASAA